jgi:hypothetical protein
MHRIVQPANRRHWVDDQRIGHLCDILIETQYNHATGNLERGKLSKGREHASTPTKHDGNARSAAMLRVGRLYGAQACA